MNELFDGMRGIEVLSAAMGVVLFLTLIFIAIYQTLHGQQIASLYRLFLIPMSMIGYSGYQHGSAADLIETLKQLTHKAEETGVLIEPEVHQTKLNDLLQRRYLSPETLLEIAETYWVFDSLEIALLYADSALVLDPQVIEEIIQNHERLPSLLVFMEESIP